MIESFRLERVPEFSEFLGSGLNLFVNFCIDFTASNLPAEDKNSNHHINPSSSKRGATPSDMNEYQKAISAVGKVLELYDQD